MEETIFSKIIAKEIPADIVYEDEHVLAFLDIRPTNKGHTLVIPKTPCRNIFDAPATTLTHMVHAAQIIAKAQKEALGADGVNLTMNNEAAAGQEVFHAHMHVIPRYADDHIFVTPKYTTYEDGEAKDVAGKISNAL